MLSDFQVIRRSLNMPNISEFVTTEEAAARSGLRAGSVRRMLREKDLEGVKIGGTWLVLKKSFEEYLIKTNGMSKNDPRRRK